MYFAFGYGLYFYFTWLPTYLIKQLGFSLLAGGLFAALPFLLAGIADLAGGWLTDRSVPRRAVCASGRCYLGFAAFLTCASLFRVDAAGAADREGPAARVRAGVRGSRARRVLGRADRHRAAITPASSPAA